MKTFAVATVLLGAMALPAFAQTDGQGAAGTVVEVPAQRPAIEPDRVYAGNDQDALYVLRAYHGLGEEYNEAVLAKMDEMGFDNVAPPLLLEYARRQWLLGDPDWSVTFGIAKTRMMFDRMVCKDNSAGQFQTIAEMEFAQFPEFSEAYVARSQEQHDADMKAGFDRFFTSKASAWWVCSHGMMNMRAAMEGRALTLDEWWIGEEARDEIRAKGEAALSGK